MSDLWCDKDFIVANRTFRCSRTTGHFGPCMIWNNGLFALTKSDDQMPWDGTNPENWA